MSDPFIAEIRAVGFNFAPRGYATCDGQTINIAQNSALFSLLGTTYGGNGVVTFGLPDLRARAPMHPGDGPGLTPRVLGETGGSANVTLLATELPAHSHTLSGVGAVGTTNVAAGNLLAGSRTLSGYSNAAATTTLAPGSLAAVGGNQPHENRQPFLGVLFVIAMQGIFPSRN